MAYTPARLYLGQPGTSETLLLPTTAVRYILKQILVTNTGAAASALSLSLCPSSVGASAANRLLAGLVVAPGSVTAIDLSQVMNIGDALSGLQTVASALTVAISGVQF